MALVWIAPSSFKILAQLLAPLMKLFTLYFSFGEWMRSSSRAKPTNSESMPSRERKDFDNWDRRAAADHHGRLAPLLLKRSRRRPKSGGRNVEAHRRGAPFAGKGRPAIGR